MALVRALANCYFNHQYQTPGGPPFQYEGPQQPFLELVSGDWTDDAQPAEDVPAHNIKPMQQASNPEPGVPIPAAQRVKQGRSPKQPPQLGGGDADQK